MNIFLGFVIFEAGVICGIVIMCFAQVSGRASRAEEQHHAREGIREPEEKTTHLE